MRLRYAGRCRVCGTALPAGTKAVYEPYARTVCCLACQGSVETPDRPAAVATERASAQPLLAGPDTPREPPIDTHPVLPDALRFRTPAAAVIAETLRVQSAAPPRTRMQRLFGRTPLSPDAQSWYVGAIGELEVGRILDRLGPEWHTLHAVPVGTRGSDIDHVAIGPGGVFTINTKHHDGAKVWVGGHRILVNGQRTDHLRNADFEATRAAKVLGEAAHQTVEVTPVLAIVGAKSIQVKERPPRVEVLRAEALGRRLERSPQILTPEDVTALVRVAVLPATWGSTSPPEADLTAFAVLRTEVVSAFRRRRAWATGGILAVMAVLMTPGAMVLLR